MIRRLLITTFLGLLFIAGALFVLPFFLPADTLKAQVESLIEQNTGWKVRLKGDVKIALFPSVRLVAEEIEVSPPDHGPIATAQTARFAVGVQALLGGGVDIEDIFLGAPNINVELDENGLPVWLGSSPTSESTGRPANGQSVQAQPNQDGAVGGVVNSLIDSLRVQSLAIDNATIRYVRSGDKPTALKDLTIKASLPDPQGALQLTGSAIFQDQPVAITASISTFKQLINEQKSPITASVEHQDAEVSLDGVIDTKAEVLFTGDLDFNAPDMAKLSQGALNQGTFNAKGTLVARDNRIDFKLTEGLLYEQKLGATFSVNTAGAKPNIVGSIGLAGVNLDEILSTSESGNASSSTSSAPSGGGNTSPVQKTDAQPDLSALSSLDADIEFAIGNLVASGQSVQNVQGQSVLKDGILDLFLTNVEAAGGVAKASAQLDSNQQPAVVFGSLDAQNFSLEALLALAGQSIPQKPTGKLSANLQYGFAGLTPETIIQSANARGTIGLSNGSVSNLGLSEIVGDPAADTINGLSVQTKFNGFDSPISVTGAANWRNEPLKFSVATDPGKLIAGQAAQSRLTLSSRKVAATFDGHLTSSIPASGNVSLQGPSLRELAKWLGSKLPEGDGYGAFAIKTSFASSGNTIDLPEISISLDDIQGNGAVTANLAGKPDINARISFDLLDVNPYMGTSSSASGGGGNNSGGSQGAGGSSSQGGSSPWSTAPIDFSFLNSINLRLAASAKTLKAQGMTVGPVALNAAIKDGRLDANLSEMTFYGGRASAQVAVDASSSTPSLKTTLNASNIQAYPFLKDAAKFERIEGLANLQFDLASSGASQAALVSGLNGTASFTFSNGAIRGINIAQGMRSLTKGALNGWGVSPTEKTDFSELGASFNIQNGQASNEDLRLIGPLVRVTGAGTVNMPQQTLNYRVNPKVVASLEGQGGAQDLAGFGVPIIIAGPWSKPRIYPDIKGFLENPQAALNTLRSLGGGFEKLADGKAGEILSQLEGGSLEQGAANKAVDLVKERTGLDVSGILKDGKIDQQNAGDALSKVIGQVSNGNDDVANLTRNVLGGFLGGQNQAQQGQTQQPQQTQPANQAPVELQPTQLGNIPVPRARPTNLSSAPATVQDVVQQVLQPQAQPQQQGQAAPTHQTPAEKLVNELPVEVPEDAQRVIQGIGNLFGN